MEWYSFSKVVHADVVLLPVLESDDVVFLRNEPVFYTDEPFGADGCHWFVYLTDGFRLGVYEVRDNVFLGYYVAID